MRIKTWEERLEELASFDPQATDKDRDACKLAEIADLRAKLAELTLRKPVGSLHRAHLVQREEPWCRAILFYSPGNSGDGPENRIPLYTQ